MTYCLMGNGLTIMADEEYLTISSTLEPPHSLPSSVATQTPTTNLTALRSQTSSTPILPLGLPSDTLTTCSLSHPSQPLTTQPPKAKDHPIQQGLLPSHYKAISKNSRPMVPPPPPPAPPLTPITAQVMSSVPPCTSPPAPALSPTVLPSPAQSHIEIREEPEKKERDYMDDDEEEDEEEEESRRKVCFLCSGSLYPCRKYCIWLKYNVKLKPARFVDKQNF